MDIMLFFIIIGIFSFVGVIIARVIARSSYSNNSISRSSQKKSYNDRKEIEQFGREGENYVAKQLIKIINTYGGYLFNDYCFEDDKGFSTEIDHILVTQGGVFIIETKTNKGIIYGNKEDEYWECVKKQYQESKYFKNPIVQNQKHINHLKRMFVKNAPKMHSIIIFPIADISYIDSNIVFNIDEAIEVIKNLIIEAKYSKDFVERIYGQLFSIKVRYGITKERHIENIDRMYN